MLKYILRDNQGVSSVNKIIWFISGALSDVNSLYNDPHIYDGDMDDTSMSSRASSRIFDTDNMITLDTINAFYESEYDNFKPTGAVSDGFETEPMSDVDFDVEGINLHNIRTMTESITRNFGQPRNDTDGESDVWYWAKKTNCAFLNETVV